MRLKIVSSVVLLSWGLAVGGSAGGTEYLGGTRVCTHFANDLKAYAKPPWVWRTDR
jgi:hypothetical protein